MDILSALNPQQREAVTYAEGPLLIIAGPGSGKTRVIAHRIAYLIKVKGINPYQIMAVTFTNKAAEELRGRVEGLLEGKLSGLTLGTFHAIGAGILRREGKRIGLDSSFVIYDEEDRLNLIKHCLHELNLDPKRFHPQAIQEEIERAKTHLLTPNKYAHHISTYFEEVASRVYQRYEERLNSSSALDFDDLIMKTVLLLKEDKEVLEKYQSRYQHLLVDEFQDTSPSQYELTKLISGKHRLICVVGDEDQSIYSWRFADIRNILDFERDFPDTKIIYLEQNYRSTKIILELASLLISPNTLRKPKRLWTENELGLPARVVRVNDEGEEARYVASQIEELNQQGIPLKECAVMYRTNAQSRVFEETFLRYGLPYKLVGALRFYQRREVKDILAYLRLLYNPTDDLSLLRIVNLPPRGIGSKTLAKLSHYADEKGMSLYQVLLNLEKIEFTSKSKQSLLSFLQLIEELRESKAGLTALFDLITERSGYREYILSEPDGEERWQNILALRQVAREVEEEGGGLEEFLQKVALVSDVDNLDEKAEAVTLITLHQAKGLEFDAVFITGLEEGLLPHYKSLREPERLEEERRLCYVGVTRARKYLYLTWAEYCPSLGGNLNFPSRFLNDILQSQRVQN